MIMKLMNWGPMKPETRVRAELRPTKDLVILRILTHFLDSRTHSIIR
jgi:hypothetical protein